MPQWSCFLFGVGPILWGCHEISQDWSWTWIQVNHVFHVEIQALDAVLVPKKKDVCVCVWVKLCSKEPLACRGTPEAHRAVSNEALYGVFRISGLITLTYLHLWNCWQAVTLRCFPSIFFFDFDPFLFLELFNPERAKFIQLWFCALNHSWPSINVHAVFSPAWNYMAYGKP